MKSITSVEMEDFAELIRLRPQETRSGEEIAAALIKRAGLVVI